MRQNRAKKYNNLIKSKLVENMFGPSLPTWAHQLIASGLINGHFRWTDLTGPFSLICSSWTVAVVNILSSPSRHWIDALSNKRYVGYEQKRHIGALLCLFYSMMGLWTSQLNWYHIRFESRNKYIHPQKWKTKQNKTKQTFILNAVIVLYVLSVQYAWITVSAYDSSMWENQWDAALFHS